MLRKMALLKGKIRILGVLATASVFTLVFLASVKAAGVVGTGTPASCTKSAIIGAVSGGGLVEFDCGGPATITLTNYLAISTATTIDGGGQITLSAGSSRHFLLNQGSLTL